VLTDTAVMMADGRNTVRGIDILRHQPDLLGAVASPATMSRALAEIDPAARQHMDTARAQVRAGCGTSSWPGTDASRRPG
jgi:hypothetical protein